MAKEVEGEENAVDEQFVGGEEIGLWERRVSDHPELELWGVGIAASSAAAAGREGLGFKFESWALHGERSGGEAEKEEVGVLRNFSLSWAQLTVTEPKHHHQRQRTNLRNSLHLANMQDSPFHRFGAVGLLINDDEERRDG